MRSAYAEIMDNAGRYDAGARPDGVIVQKMAVDDMELVVSLGGIYVEALKDVAFRMPPVTAGRLAELDLNPVMAGADAAAAVDWLMITR